MYEYVGYSFPASQLPKRLSISVFLELVKLSKRAFHYPVDRQILWFITNMTCIIYEIELTNNPRYVRQIMVTKENEKPLLLYKLLP